MTQRAPITSRSVPSQATTTLEDSPLPFSLSTPSIMAEYDVIQHGIYIFGQFGSALPAVSPPNFLLTPSSLAWRKGEERSGENMKALMLCKNCPQQPKLRCYQHHFIHKSHTQHHTGCCEENFLSQLESVSGSNNYK